MSTRKSRVKTPHTVSPRVPAPWQSAQGEAGPKARPQRRSRWQAGEDSGPARSVVEPDRGPWNEGPAALWMAVQPGRAQAREGSARGGGNPKPSRPGVDTREKPVGEGYGRPYRKPTQVGEASSLR